MRYALLLLVLAACGQGPYETVTDHPVVVVAREISEAYFDQEQPYATVRATNDRYVDIACGPGVDACLLYTTTLVREDLDNVALCEAVAREYGRAQCVSITGHRYYGDECDDYLPYFTTTIFEECNAVFGHQEEV